VSTMKSAKFQKGVAVIELALVLPTLLIMTFLVTELGRAIMQYNALTKSVRDGARYLTTQTPGTGITQARNLVVHGNTAGTGTTVAPGLTNTNVPDPTWQLAGALPQINTVTLRVQGYAFRPMVGSVFGVGLGPYTFSDIVVTMRSHN
jgi:Flp pilus assembly protein TadG